MVYNLNSLSTLLPIQDVVCFTLTVVMQEVNVVAQVTFMQATNIQVISCLV